jgi:23S rRNA (uracil1939-C5)-methyltransferase
VIVPTLGDRIELTIDDLSYLGDGVGHLDRSFAVFVKGALPGERVVAVVEERRRRYARGELVEVLEPSAHRVSAPCRYFPACGGCQWQGLAYDQQLIWKTELIRRQLQHVGHLVDPPVQPMIGAANPWHYRNQARFSVDPTGHLAFTRAHSHNLLPIDVCLIMQQPIVELMPRLQRVLPGAHQIVVRYGARTGQLVIAPELPIPSSELPSGQPFYEEVLLGRTYRVSTPSFFQVNTRVDDRPLPSQVRQPWVRQLAGVPVGESDLSPADEPIVSLSQTDLLALIVLDRLNLTGQEVVVDAYGGVGTFALLIAQRARLVFGIDEAHSAVLDAEHNARDVENVHFLVGRTEELLATIEPKPDAVVVDPSRVGCAPEVLQALIANHPNTIVYVSCDPATLARDLEQLQAGDYRLEDVQPIDMFPQTHHIEAVCLLKAAEAV